MRLFRAQSPNSASEDLFPGHPILHFRDFAIGNAGDGVGAPGLGIDSFELGRFDHGIQGRPVQIEVMSRDPVAQEKAVDLVIREMEYIGGFADVSDNRPFPRVEWEIDVDRTRAAEFGAYSFG